MEPDHQRWPLRELLQLRHRRAGRACRQRLPRLCGAGRRRRDSPIRILRRVQGSPPMVETTYLPVMCNHCDDAPCIRYAGDAIRKRDDGIVIIDRSEGQGPQGHRRLLPLSGYHLE
jgi:Fe-S-cluster-containing hydrogenase component 2